MTLWSIYCMHLSKILKIEEKVCCAIGLTFARQNKDRSHLKREDLPRLDHKQFRINRKFSKFCSNNTIAQIYLKEISSVIDVLQANSSYNSILKLQSANFITYLKNTTNQQLLHNNCEAFIKGLKTAKKADETAQHAQQHLAATIRKKIKQVTRDVTNGKGFYDLDN
ncbi:unnamed protein product [Rotaria sp. Silwood2]|nr:unnamed protein product [Rotaria sp. Silwood2]CAF4399777.1 unnamed protein product [Rotaria sp. Silwood2]